MKSIVFGTAVGDAMGVPFEFKERDTLHCTHPVGNGTYDMSAGTFSDDTSLRDAMKGVDLKKAIEDNIPDDDRFAFLHDVASRSRDKVPSSGFVLDTLEAALWCNLHTESYAECVQEAVNLGDDTDTTACVAGALSGAIHGYRSIPENWLNTLRGKKMMKGCLF